MLTAIQTTGLAAGHEIEVRGTPELTDTTVPVRDDVTAISSTFPA
jgi:hypothetical protein